MTNKKKLLLIRFQNSLHPGEIEAFRGAIVNSLENKDILFHNHFPEKNKLRYSYPLIQYKSIHSKAAIFCLDAAIEKAGTLFTESDFELDINGKKDRFIVDNVKAYHYPVQLCDTMFHYRILKWMPLNQKNYEIYNKLESITEKSRFLENILCANILSFAKGLNIFFENKVDCIITWLSEPVIARYKGVRVTLFDAEFSTNVSIPDFAGLGKGVSIGYGTTVRKQNRK